MTCFRNALAQLKSDSRASAAVSLALSVIVLAGITGLAIDAARAYGTLGQNSPLHSVARNDRVTAPHFFAEHCAAGSRDCATMKSAMICKLPVNYCRATDACSDGC